MFLFVPLNEQLGKFAKSVTQATCYLGEGKCWLTKMLHFARHESSLRWVHAPKEVASESQGMPDGSGGIHARKETERPYRMTAWDGHAGAASSWR